MYSYSETSRHTNECTHFSVDDTTEEYKYIDKEQKIIGTKPKQIKKIIKVSNGFVQVPVTKTRYNQKKITVMKTKYRTEYKTVQRSRQVPYVNQVQKTRIVTDHKPVTVYTSTPNGRSGYNNGYVTNYQYVPRTEYYTDYIPSYKTEYYNEQVPEQIPEQYAVEEIQNIPEEYSTT
jgi:aspartate-semialdehyde dehydrogenase